jgi:RNA polymerase sigma-70 factor (ECF subfamily)
MIKRTNEEWLDALRGPERNGALEDLRALLVRGLGRSLGGDRVDQATVEDLVQDALLRILGGVDSFLGECRFTTWAHRIAIRVAFSELRRRRWRDVSLEEMIEVTKTYSLPRGLADPDAGTERQATQRMWLGSLREIIDEELTDKQHQAVVAVYLRGMPLEEVARRMGSNRNALYKLLHDARQRIKQRLMVKEGVSPQEFLRAFGE